MIYCYTGTCVMIYCYTGTCVMIYCYTRTCVIIYYYTSSCTTICDLYLYKRLHVWKCESIYGIQGHIWVWHFCWWGCKQHIHCFLDKGDAGSTGNLRKHAVSCWGETAVTAVASLPNIKEARKSVIDFKNTGSITAAFEKKGRGKLTYSHRQHTKTETKCVCHPLQRSVAFLTTCRAAIVCWVCKNLRPFSIVHDQGFRILIKTGRPEYYLPSSSTVSLNVRLVFANIQKWIAKMMKVSFEIQRNL